MFVVNINGTPVLFSKFFSPADAEAIVRETIEICAVPDLPHSVLFVDTAATEHLVFAVRALVQEGIVVHVRDHHDVDGEPSTPRDQAIRSAVQELQFLLGPSAVISNRRDNPACSWLFSQPGEFIGKVGVVVADPDPDGLLGAMTALMPAKQLYPELDSDADLLDGPRAGQIGLSPFGHLLAVGMSTLPPFNSANPGPSEEAKGKLFATFVAAVQGNTAAREDLKGRVATFEVAVAEAQRLAASAIEMVPGVVLVDTRGAPRHDLGTLAADMEARTGCRITVVLKDSGPIAAKHDGEQFSLAIIVRAYQQGLNIQSLLPEGFTSSPESGIICNTSFLAHVSRQVWEEWVFPALRILSA